MASNLCLEPRYARLKRPRALQFLGILAGQHGAVQLHQQGPLLHNVAFAGVQSRQNPSLDTLNDLNVAGRHDAPVASGDFFQLGHGRPQQPHNDHRDDRKQQ